MSKPPEFAELSQLLRSQRQLLLLGSPGSGKSHWARLLARELVAQENYQLPYADLTPPDQDLLMHPSSGQVRTVHLHPAYSHDLFIEGWRNELVQGQAASVLRDGAFKRLCRDAAARPALTWGLILEDIHRCEPAALFGESLALLGRRNQRIWLPGSGDSILLTERAVVIATCQTKALPSLDPVWLRHFAVVELSPDSSVLAPLTLPDGSSFYPANWLDALNERLKTKLGASAAGEALGQGYFFWQDDPPYDFAEWRQRFDFQVRPRLRQLASQYGFGLDDLLGSVAMAEDEAALLMALRARFPEAFKA